MGTLLMTVKPPPFKIITAFAAVYILWGSTYLAIRIAIETLPPFLMAGTRFLCAGILLYLLVPSSERVTPSRIQWKSAVTIGALLLLGGNGAVCWAQQKVPSGITALIIATVPLWTVLLEWLWMRRPAPSWLVLTGVLLGFGGLWLLIRPEAEQASIPLTGGLILLGAALSWSIGSILARKVPQVPSAFQATSMEMLSGGALLLIAGCLSGEVSGLGRSVISTRSLLALAYLILFGALLGFTAYKYILKNTSPLLSSTYAYVNPIIAVFLGWAFAAEPLGHSTVAGAACIIAAVFMITFFSAQKQKSSPV